MRLSNFIAKLALAQFANCLGSGREVSEGYSINLTLTDQATVKFDVQLQLGTWMGLNLGATQTEGVSDYLLFTAGEVLEFSDRHIGQSQSAQLDLIENLEGTVTQEGELVRFEVQRLLDTGDALEDFVIPTDTNFGIMWTVGTVGSSLNQSAMTGMLEAVRLDSNSINVPIFEESEQEQLSPEDLTDSKEYQRRSTLYVGIYSC